jgi:hypothetical protein
MTSDVRLANVLNACRVLDHPRVTAEQIKGVAQFCGIF